jgi:hypothetical protein
MNISRFYRNGTSQFVLVGSIARTGAIGYRTSEGWERASGLFNDEGDTTYSPGPYPSSYSDDYDGGETTGGAMKAAAPSWVVNKSDTNDVLISAVNTALTDAGYARPDGTVIT